jgi:hypothetical protein
MESPVNNKHPGGRPLKYTPEFMDAKLTEYIQQQTEQQKPVTITGYCQYIGTSRDTLLDYDNHEQFSDVLKRIRGAAETYLVDFMLSGKNPAGAIFLAKNHFNYSDKTTVEHTGNTGQLIAPDVAVQFLTGLVQVLGSVQQLGPATINVTPETVKSEPIPVAIPVDAEETTD